MNLDPTTLLDLNAFRAAVVVLVAAFAAINRHVLHPASFLKFSVRKCFAVLNQQLQLFVDQAPIETKHRKQQHASHEAALPCLAFTCRLSACF